MDKYTEAANKYLEAMNHSTKVFKRLMKVHPERAKVWKTTYLYEMDGILTVATYDRDISPEKHYELLRVKGERTDDLI